MDCHVRRPYPTQGLVGEISPVSADKRGQTSVITPVEEGGCKCVIEAFANVPNTKVIDFIFFKYSMTNQLYIHMSF